jgi:hypothetical protein
VRALIMASVENHFPGSLDFDFVVECQRAKQKLT